MAPMNGMLATTAFEAVQVGLLTLVSLLFVITFAQCLVCELKYGNGLRSSILWPSALAVAVEAFLVALPG